MEFGKIDAALAATLSGARIAKLPVFISLHEAPNSATLKLLRSYGLTIRPSDSVVAAELSADALGSLSELACVKSIRLSGRSNLAPSPPLLRGGRLRRSF